jgi:hypothetical protein
MIGTMKSELRGRWLNGLRRGGYRQGTGAMLGFESDGSRTHCAMGVLLDVMFPGIKSVTTEAHVALIMECSELIRAGVISRNDTEHLPFTAIADWIEKNVGERVPDAATIGATALDDFKVIVNPSAWLKPRVTISLPPAYEKELAKALQAPELVEAK